MKNPQGSSLKAIVALMLFSLLFPLTSLAQQATPIVGESKVPDVVTKPGNDSEDVETSSSTPEAIAPASRSRMSMSGLTP